MTEQSSGGEVQRLIGLILAVVGVMLLAFSGLCGVSMISSMVSDGGLNNEAAFWAFGVLIVSGFSAAAGYGIFVVGRGLRARK